MFSKLASYQPGTSVLYISNVIDEIIFLIFMIVSNTSNYYSSYLAPQCVCVYGYIDIYREKK